jgi:hypothetical protein
LVCANDFSGTNALTPAGGEEAAAVMTPGEAPVRGDRPPVALADTP